MRLFKPRHPSRLCGFHPIQLSSLINTQTELQSTPREFQISHHPDGIFVTPDTYDPTKPRVDLLDIDANNLYGKAMSDPLPVRGFRWLTEEEIAVLDISSYDEHSRVGYIFEVDLDVPDAVY